MSRTFSALVATVLPDGRRHRVGAGTRVRRESPPEEFLLFLAGRNTASDVRIDGDGLAIRTLAGNLARHTQLCLAIAILPTAKLRDWRDRWRAVRSPSLSAPVGVSTGSHLLSVRRL